MITKFISSAMAIVTLDVYLQGQLHSNDPLFLFASSGAIINGIMLLLAAITVMVSFRGNFKSWYEYMACLTLAVALGTIGAVGSFFSNVDYTFSNILLPLDYLFILQAAIVLGICSLSYSHAPAPGFVKQLPGTLLNRLSGLIPKLPRPAHGGRMRHA